MRTIVIVLIALTLLVNGGGLIVVGLSQRSENAQRAAFAAAEMSQFEIAKSVDFILAKANSDKMTQLFNSKLKMMRYLWYASFCSLVIASAAFAVVLKTETKLSK